MHRIHRTLAVVAVQGMLAGCMSPTGPAKLELNPTKGTTADRTDDRHTAAPEQRETPVAAPTSPDPPPPPTTGPASISALVGDLALLHRGQLICTDATQCSGDASWANCDRGTPKIAANDEVRVVTDGGVADMVLVPHASRPYRVSVAPANANEQADKIELGLTLRNARPSATARLAARRLDANVSAAEANAVLEWLEKTSPDSLGPTKLRPIGTVAGTFGDGVNRILVFAPTRRLTEEQLEMLRGRGPDDLDDHDIAVLLADGEPRGVLPLGTVAGLEVVHAVDLDGDGTEELVWISQAAVGDLFTAISVSYFNGRTFAVREVAGCSYAGCDEFIPAEKCGHSVIKPPRPD